MNSPETESQATTQMPTNSQSPDAPSSSEDAPLLSLPPGVSLLAPKKPLIEMTDEELAAWDVRQREHLTSPQTLAAHVRGTIGKQTKETIKPNISEYD